MNGQKQLLSITGWQGVSPCRDERGGSASPESNEEGQPRFTEQEVGEGACPLKNYQEFSGTEVTAL